MPVGRCCRIRRLLVSLDTLQRFRVLEYGPVTVDGAVDEPGHHPQDDADTEQDSGDRVLARIPPGPRTYEVSARERTQDGERRRSDEMFVRLWITAQHQAADVDHG